MAYKYCVIHIFKTWPIEKLKKTKFEIISEAIDLFDIERTLLLSNISESKILVYSPPEIYESFIKDNPNYSLYNISFYFNKISLTDHYVIDLLTSRCGFEYPVPFQILEYLVENPHLYSKMIYSYIPEDEKSLILFNNLGIKARNTKTAEIAQKWCEKHDKYFDFIDGSYKDLFIYSRALINDAYLSCIECHDAKDIEFVVSVIKRSPLVKIAVPTLDLLYTLENELIKSLNLLEKLKEKNVKYFELLSQNIAYWKVDADETYYSKLNNYVVRSKVACRAALLYYAKSENIIRYLSYKTPSEDILYLKSLNIDLNWLGKLLD